MTVPDHTIRDSSRMLTYQDLVRAGDGSNKAAFVLTAINQHVNSVEYDIAMTADLYDRQMNKTINDYVQRIFDLTGSKLVDFTASNNKIASNFFHRLNTQRNMYSLGAGVSFVDVDEYNTDGVDTTKEKLGPHFDHDLRIAAYDALIHGVSFCFWNLDRMHVFPLTEFVPFWDERDGTLRAGARFWRLDWSRPMQVVLYEEDGYTRFETRRDSSGSESEMLVMTEEKRAYIQHIEYVPADGEEQVIGEENYSALPVVPLWGSRLKQSTLVGMRQAIDSYDLIRSGFANDLTDCAEIYWIVENAGGMTDVDLARFRDRLRLNHIAVTDSDEGGSVTPYTQEVPYQARKQYLDDIRSEIYEDFGALDVHTVAAGATNDHIDAAYQPLDEEAADFEYQISECVQQILKLIGIEDKPVFKRTRISNQSEQVQMVVQEAQWLDQETILRKLPNISPSEVVAIMKRIEAEDQERMVISQQIATGQYSQQAQQGDGLFSSTEEEEEEEEDGDDGEGDNDDEV